MSSTTSFISQMLELRNQKLREQLAAEAADQAAMQSLASGITSAAGSFAKAIPKMQENATANQLMNEYFAQPPRAQAVNPALQGPADIAASQQPGFYRGGVDELKMRLAMQDQTSQRMNEALRNDASAQRLDISWANLGLAQTSSQLAAEREARIKEQAEADRARQARAAAGTEYDKAFKQTDAYNQSMQQYTSALAKAKTREEYDAAVNAINTEYMAGQKLGIKAEKPIITPWIDQAARDAIAAQEAAITGTQQSIDRWKGGLIPDVWQGVTQNESLLSEQQRALQGMPGYEQTRPGYVPPPQPSGMIAPYPSREQFMGGTTTTAAPTTAAPANPPMVRDAQGNILKWDGRAWVPGP